MNRFCILRAECVGQGWKKKKRATTHKQSSSIPHVKLAKGYTANELPNNYASRYANGAFAFTGVWKSLQEERCECFVKLQKA